MSAILDRRIGKFVVARRTINHDPHVVRAMLADAIVLTVDWHVVNDELIYTAIHHSFARLPEGAVAVPEYTAVVTVTRDFDGREDASVRWR